MNDTAPNNAPSRPRRTARAAQPEGEVLRIDVPHPPASAMNPNRPVTELIKAQLRHIRHAESGRLPKHKRSDIKLEDIRTEAQAAAYIRSVTKLLHPPRRSRKKTAPPRA